MEALIGLMLLLAFLGTLDFSTIFSHKSVYSSPVINETERERIKVL